jgi:hypothetical protein
MKLNKDGYIYETNNTFVIEQMKKYGAVEVKTTVEVNKTIDKKNKLKK